MYAALFPVAAGKPPQASSSQSSGENQLLGTSIQQIQELRQFGNVMSQRLRQLEHSIGYFTPQQQEWLTPWQINQLNPQQIPHLKSSKVVSQLLRPELIQQLHRHQLGWLAPWQIEYLTPQQQEELSSRRLLQQQRLSKIRELLWEELQVGGLRLYELLQRLSLHNKRTIGLVPPREESRLTLEQRGELVGRLLKKHLPTSRKTDGQQVYQDPSDDSSDMITTGQGGGTGEPENDTEPTPSPSGAITGNGTGNDRPFDTTRIAGMESDVGGNETTPQGGGIPFETGTGNTLIVIGGAADRGEGIP